MLCQDQSIFPASALSDQGNSRDLSHEFFTLSRQALLCQLLE